ncbi:uncharacterized protein MYCFIDRAFT_175029 [Pseudocercospora fijiensis CIRAD86]|uniref:Uncharacterized protein n=1 Tax=Pseudocercospora fijiensis (strain CIRAD86) TaxID=383855 RepID=M2ZX87_PSEFD|nr:uncharacterized protein MYCFIDRAFT_175029 [Pseudocercospora fijiensis CIRAD86]EME83604.1 hypothetical protein MYCFIDRAFT_175029 [Pseudocercospora fijiensis CIRAD86]
MNGHCHFPTWIGHLMLLLDIHISRSHDCYASIISLPRVFHRRAVSLYVVSCPYRVRCPHYALLSPTPITYTGSCTRCQASLICNTFLNCETASATPVLIPREAHTSKSSPSKQLSRHPRRTAATHLICLFSLHFFEHAAIVPDTTTPIHGNQAADAEKFLSPISSLCYNGRITFWKEHGRHRCEVSTALEEGGFEQNWATRRSMKRFGDDMRMLGADQDML